MSETQPNKSAEEWALFIMGNLKPVPGEDGFHDRAVKALNAYGNQRAAQELEQHWRRTNYANRCDHDATTRAAQLRSRENKNAN